MSIFLSSEGKGKSEETATQQLSYEESVVEGDLKLGSILLGKRKEPDRDKGTGKCDSPKRKRLSAEWGLELRSPDFPKLTSTLHSLHLVFISPHVTTLVTPQTSEVT